ncbi:MAG: tyrosine-type recombinase/integrase [Acidimicrobiales bacterium]
MSRRRYFGSVRRLGSGRFQASYWHDGSRHVGTVTYVTKAEARSYLDSVSADLHRGTWTDPVANRIRLTDYANNWLETRPNLRPRTVELYRRLLDKKILPALGTTMIAELSPSTVRTWHAALATDHPSTAAKAYRLLATVMNTAVADDLILRSPCRVKGAGVERAPERPIPTIAEVDELAAAMPERMAMIVVLAAWCQLRRGEVLGLRRRDVDLLHGVLVIEQTVQHFVDGRIVFGPPKTAAGRRRVVVPPHLAPALTAHLDRFVDGDPDALVFTGAKGGPLRPHVLQSAWDTARRKVGRPEIHLHDLRHAGATWAASTGASTAELMARLGHASPRAALIYQHATDDRDRALAGALSKLASPGEVVPFQAQGSTSAR